MGERRSAFQRTAIVVDAVAATACAAIAARLPLPVPTGARLIAEGPTLLLALVVLQVAALAVAGAYRPLPVPRKIRRLAIGCVAGTAAAAVLAEWLFRVPPDHRAFYALYFVLCLAFVGAWRAVRVMWITRGARVPETASAFVDRTTDRVSPFEMLAAVVRYRGFLRNLVIRDLKLKYRGSVLGFMWSLLNPLAMVAAYTLAFQYILQAGPERFAFFVLTGLLAWSFFANSAGMSTNAMIESAGLLKAIPFPRAILPVSNVLFNLAQYLLTMLVFLPVMLAIYGLAPSWPMLAFPAMLLLQVAFTTGVALALSAVTAFFRDMRHLVEVTLSIMFWTTPVLYSVEQIPNESLRGVISLSPLSSYVSAYQRIFYHSEWPDPTMWVLGAVYAVAGLAVGSVLFYSLEDSVGEQL